MYSVMALVSSHVWFVYSGAIFKYKRTQPASISGRNKSKIDAGIYGNSSADHIIH